MNHEYNGNLNNYNKVLLKYFLEKFTFPSLIWKHNAESLLNTSKNR